MKKIITLFALMLCLCATAQQAVDTMYIYRNNKIERIPVAEIDSVVFVQPVAPNTPVTPPSTSQYEAVDLGLSVKWATCNVGASKPEEYGGYYAWGETEEKSNYDWSTYKWCNGSEDIMTKYCTDSSDGTVDNKTVLDPEDDVAHVKWGGSWRMPSLAEQKELFNNCSWTWTTLNGVTGYRVTGPNGNSIFLPNAGVRDGTDVYYRDGSGFWSSSLYSYSCLFAYGLCIHDGTYDWYRCKRFCGVSVRPVCDETSNPDSGSSRTYTVNGVSFTMIAVKGGTFQMGATAEHADYANSDEKPVHSVTLSDYYIGETEVTQELWVAVMGSNPSFYTGNKCPVEEVSWNDCQTFITKLNALTGENFKLPTEAQWEYAARGGNKASGYLYSGSNNIGDVAWYNNNSTHPVKTKAPNELGIYDMSGNVWEWCSDWFGDYSSSSITNPTGPSSGSGRVLRGGSRNSSAKGCRVANRDYGAPDGRGSHIGLRLAR